jgi:hypothetical protein
MGGQSAAIAGLASASATLASQNLFILTPLTPRSAKRGIIYTNPALRCCGPATADGNFRAPLFGKFATRYAVTLIKVWES